jgi:hypothetical protein
MKIIKEKISINELKQMTERKFGDFVRGCLKIILTFWRAKIEQISRSEEEAYLNKVCD